MITVAEYIAMRDKAVLGPLDEFMVFAAKWMKRPFSNSMSAEIAQHKMRTAIPSLPRDIRKASYDWLTARGYETQDDGDLRD